MVDKITSLRTSSHSHKYNQYIHLLYKPFVRDVEMAMYFANKYYFHGRLKISETYRTMERQQYLYEQGRTREGKKVTNAKAGESFHNYGCAVDFWIETYDGKYETDLEPYKLLERVMVQFGLAYLRIHDYGHFQCAASFDMVEFYKKQIEAGATHEQAVRALHAELDKERFVFEGYKKDNIFS